LQETIKKWPNDGVALVHYGFILKTTDNNLTGGVEYMQGESIPETRELWMDASSSTLEMPGHAWEILTKQMRYTN